MTVGKAQDADILIEIKKSLDEIKQRLDGVERKFDELRDDVEQRLGKMEQRFDEFRDDVEQKLNELERNFERLRTSFFAVEEGILAGKKTLEKVREYRQKLVSDYTGFNARGWIEENII